MMVSKEQYQELISTFGAGWEKGDEQKIASAFTPEAAFLPAPFESAVRGRDAIRSYWKNTPREQSEVQFRSGEIFVAGPWFAVEFRCTFRRRRTGERMDVRGALFCETEGDLISEMRMYWHRDVASN
jgi:ketosteroid isomerase-like protein